MKIADYPEVQVDLTPNAFECVDDDELNTIDPGDSFDEDETRCPWDDGHYVRPVLITAETAIPAGVPAEVAEEYYHHGRKQHEFALDPES